MSFCFCCDDSGKIKDEISSLRQVLEQSSSSSSAQNQQQRANKLVRLERQDLEFAEIGLTLTFCIFWWSVQVVLIMITLLYSGRRMRRHHARCFCGCVGRGLLQVAKTQLLAKASAADDQQSTCGSQIPGDSSQPARAHVGSLCTNGHF